MVRKLFKFLVDKLLSLTHSRQALAWLGSFLLCLLVVLLTGNSSSGFGRNNGEFEVGKVADRDVIAEYSINYEDEQATRLRVESRERLVPAVFQYSYRASEELQSRWNRFVTLAESLPTEIDSASAVINALQSEFPGDFPDDVLDLLYQSGELPVILGDCSTILSSVLEKGIYSIPQAELEFLNPDVVELIRQTGSRIELERIPLWSIITMGEAGQTVESIVASGSYASKVDLLAPKLLKPFLLENVFYSPGDTARRILETRSATEPVVRHIEQGKRIIRKGFVVTEEDMEELMALRMSLPENNLPENFANLIFLLMLFGLLMFFSGKRIIDRKMTDRET